MMMPVWTVCWSRPVIRAARVGEHSAVVLNALYFRPLAARASSVGVGIGPPNELEAPKPTSSVKMTRIFGAPSGAFTGWGKSDFDLPSSAR